VRHLPFEAVVGLAFLEFVGPDLAPGLHQDVAHEHRLEDLAPDGFVEAGVTHV